MKIEEYVQSKQGELKSLEESLAVRGAKMSDAVHAKRDEVMKRLDALRHETGDRWDVMRMGFESAWDELKSAFETVTAKDMNAKS
jgi:hypothetical protein